MPKITTIVNAQSRSHGHRVIDLHPSDIRGVENTKSYWIEQPLALLKLKDQSSVYVTHAEWERYLGVVLDELRSLGNGKEA